MKKVISILIIFFSLFLTGCSRQLEIYNKKDESDFQGGAVVKFNVIQFKNVIDEKTLKEMNINGGYFLCFGSTSVQSKETTEVFDTYYMYVKNKNEAIYFAKIPSDKVRIYEDAEDTPYLIANYTRFPTMDVNRESNWDDYERFNLHVPKGTIIPKISFNFDVSTIK
jgi:hypothetical protein